MKIAQFLKNSTSKNYKAYLLFLVLTFILWFAIQLTKSYKFESELTVQLTNVPKHLVLDSSKQRLNLNLNSNGFKLWRFNMSSNIFKIDYNDFEIDSFQLKLTDNKLKNKIAKKYELNLEDIDVDKALLRFNFERKETKWVTVEPNLKLNFADGYNTLNNLTITPDSVLISGSLKDLKNVKFVETVQVEIENLNDTLRGNIKLLKPDSNVEISTEEVKYFLPVEKFSENAVMVDIQTINIPDSLELNVFPNQAKVSFLVSLKSFDKVSNLDFKVVCNYTQRYQEDGIMIPKLVKYPDNILNPKLHTKKIDYLVKQKL